MRKLLSIIQTASRSLCVISVTLFVLLILPIRGHAQCDLSPIAASAYETCADVLSPVVSLGWVGGTPPFNVYIETPYGAITQIIVTTQDWSGPINATLYDPQAQVTITDAVGCMEGTTVGWQNHVSSTPELLLMHSCTTGGTLRWTGQFFISNGSVAEPSYCAGPFMYQITNNTTGAVWSGSVTTDWVQESPASWRFLQYIPAGAYSASVNPSNALPSPSCDSFVHTECYMPAYFEVPTDPGDCGTNFNLRAALAGVLPSGTLMTDQLRSAGLLPLVEPYSAVGYSYVGTASGTSIPASMLTVTGSDAIVDWVVVEICQPNAPYAVLHSRPALIQRDGDVIDADGSSYINAPLTPGSYRIALRHRNHLGVMSNTRTLSLSPTSTLVDLSSLSTSVYGSNARVAVGSKQCLWPGDANFNGQVRYTGTNNDRDLILTAIGGATPTNTVTNTYSPLDINMDGTIRYTGTNNDRDIILQTIGGVVPTATRMQQLP